VATEGLAHPIAAARTRPAWLETFAGQALALLASFGIALLARSLLIVAYGERPDRRVLVDLRCLARIGRRHRVRARDRDAADLRRPRVSVCFKGGMFNIGVEGQYLVAMITAGWAEVKLDFLPGPLLVPPC
jgi:hypothetical protein